MKVGVGKDSVNSARDRPEFGDWRLAQTDSGGEVLVTVEQNGSAIERVPIFQLLIINTEGGDYNSQQIWDDGWNEQFLARFFVIFRVMGVIGGH